MAKLFTSIPKTVEKQLIARQEAYSAVERTKDLKLYQNSNTGWVRLRSGVNILDNASAKEYFKNGGAPPSGDSTLARSMVLSSGTLNYNENPNRGSAFPRGGVQFGESTSAVTGAYHNSPSTGFRPMPGITSVDISTEGNYGVIRKANVSFKVFSKEDLDDIELLYFRLGYMCLLEWGHSVYVNNSSKVSFASKGNYISNGLWFGYNNDSSINSECAKLRNSTDHNYEAMYGKIQNFSWKLQTDGSYDCSIDIISKGIIVEGLLIAAPSDGAKKEELDKEKDKLEKTLDENRSIFHFILKNLEKKKTVEKITLSSELKTDDEKPLSAASYFNSKDIGLRTSLSLGPGKSMLGKFFRNTQLNPVYISLRTFLKIINEIGFPKKDNKQQIVKFDLDSENTYRTFPEHFSLQPDSVWLPKKPSGQTPDNYYFNKKDQETIFSDMTSYAGSNGGDDNILNIFLSHLAIMGVVETIVDGPTEGGVGIMDLVKAILAKIKDALGDINDFYIHFDEETSLYSISDDYGPKETKKNKIAEIKISGLGSTVLDINTECKVSGDMMSSIAIASQGTQTAYADPLSNLIRFNRGARDRHFPSMQQGDEKPKTTADLAKEFTTIFKRYKVAWDDYNENDVMDPELWLQMKAEGKKLFTFYSNKNEIDKDLPPPMSVPVYLNLTLKGISGFAIGYVFTVSKGLLPDAYGDKAFVVRSVEHTIDKSGWITTVGASMYGLTA